MDFVFDNGLIVDVKGHRGMLCAGSEEYAGLFRSGMVEAQEGKIRVPPCVGAESFRGFLEWLYLGELSAVLFALDFVLAGVIISMEGSGCGRS